MTEFRLEGGRVLPLHQHPYEQTGYLVCGRLRLTIGPEQHDTRPGDSWCLPPDVIHARRCSRTASPSRSSPRPLEDYLPRVRTGNL
jgi:quercetin dioxygenase-like cupin family protein